MNMEAANSFYVTLNKDMTKLYPGLVKGSIGLCTLGRVYTAWGRTSDRYWGVHFDNGMKIDLLSTQLDFLSDYVAVPRLSQ
jgi:hypothetical protein